MLIHVKDGIPSVCVRGDSDRCHYWQGTKVIIEIWVDKYIGGILHYPPLLPCPSHFGGFFFSRCSPIISVILASTLCVYLPLCCAVHLLHVRYCYLLVVFLLWIRVFFSLDMPSWMIYRIKVTKEWGNIPHDLDSLVWGVISHTLDSSVWELSLTTGLNKFFSDIWLSLS
jgi:hypothetical protein